jgi:membrane protein YqaA with SNARE-associated domain
MTYKFQNNYGVERIVKLAIICTLLSNIGGFCLGYIIGEIQREKKLRQKNFIIEKVEMPIYNKIS